MTESRSSSRILFLISGYFIALLRDLAQGDHGLAGVERGGEQVDGCAVGAGSAHRLAVDGQADQRVAGFVDRVGGVPGEPGAHGVVERVAVQAGEEPSQGGGVRRAGGQTDLFAQVVVGIGGEAGDGGQGRGSAEDGDQAQRASREPRRYRRPRTRRGSGIRR